jgi:hypothetical protein
MLKKKTKKIKAKPIKIDPVHSFYNDVEKLHAKVKTLELGKYSPLVIAVESLKQKVLDYKERPRITTIKQK